MTDPVGHMEVCQPVHIASTGAMKHKYIRHVLELNMSYFSVISLPADDLALVGVMASAGAVLTWFVNVYALKA